MPCHNIHNHFSTKTNGSFYLKSGKIISFKPNLKYEESFESFTDGQKLSADGSFAATLNIPGGADSFTTRSGVGISNSFGAEAASDTCNTFTCFSWDTENDKDFTFEASLKWNHLNLNPSSEGEVFFINFRESLTASTGVTNASNRVGILLSKKTNGDYAFYATDVAAPKTLIATISKADIEYNTTDTNWIRIITKVSKSVTSNRWNVDSSIYSLGSNGTSPMSLIVTGSASNLYDSNLYDKNAYFQFFVYGFSTPQVINNSFVLDNLTFYPLPS